MTLDEALRVAEEACVHLAKNGQPIVAGRPMTVARMQENLLAADALARLREELPKIEEVANFLMMLCIAAEK